MRRNKLIIMGLIALSFFAVGCGGKEEDVDSKPPLENVKEELKDSDITFEAKEDFLVVKSEFDGNIKFTLREFDKIVAEGTVSKDTESKIYNLIGCKKDMAYEYTLDLVSGDKKVVKNLNYANMNTDKKPDLGVDQSKLDKWDSKAKKYKKGDQVLYEERNYECLQEHTSQEGWNPKDAVSLWVEFKE